jgi:outer membrane protein OmpA-like peptidoglycan-associated protein
VRCIQNWEAACKDRLGGVMDKTGKTYRTLKIGDQVWMAEDLILDRLDEMEARSLGRACPSGWHVPEQAEYEQLFSKASDFDLRANDKRARTNRDVKENPCSLNFDFKRGYWTASSNGNEMTYVDWKYNAIREKASPYFKHGDAYTNKLRCVKNAPSSAKPAVKTSQAPAAPANNVKNEANKTILEKFILQGVTFGVGQSKFTRESSDGLNRLASHLRNYNGKTIEIVSHTDNLDRPERSRVLALKRAEEVKSYLLMAGLSGQDIIATGKGGDEPLVPNTTPDNRMKNNRIEVFVYSYDAPIKAAQPQQQKAQPAAEAAPKKCKERDMANNKLGECYSYVEGTKDHRRCMAAYKNLLNLANSKCK